MTMETVLLPNGLELVCHSRAELLHFYEDIFEKQVYVQHGIRLAPGARVFDVGANAGTFTVFVATTCPGAEIFAFEPAPPTFELLRRNAARYAPAARLFNLGVSDHAGSARLTHYPRSSGMSSFFADQDQERESLRAVLLNEAQRGDEGARALLRHSDDYLEERLRSETFECPLVTLSEIIRRHGVERIDLLKIDVQKSELEVLRGLSDEDWARIGQVVLEVHDLEGRAGEIRALLEQHGFEVDAVQDELYRGSVMFNVYGVRPGWRVGAAAAEPARSEAVYHEPAPVDPGDASGIAIIGMAGRFPGAADVETFWRNLEAGVESIRVLSREELLAAGADPALIDAPNYVPAGGLLDDPELFDAAFFGFGAREAELTDPQHRLFLETSWQALEDAGWDAERFDGAIAVFGGMNLASYLLHNLVPNPSALAGASAVEIRIRNDKDFLASQVAYKLGLTGPAFTVQSACSTSLVAVSQACQSLLGYQCDMALAGGVSLGCPPRAGYMAQAGVFSPDGHCRAFDAAAQGTVNGQGVGVVVLKRLASALADGDTIHAVIKGFAVNNDGALKIGYTAPSVEGQAEVVAMAQAVAGIDPATVTYVEAHGTGTPMGDPVEVAALTQVFRESTDRTGFCALGSVKTNVGHLDAAAGVAALIKTTLALEHATLPPSLHYERPNPQIDFAASPFFVVDRRLPWPTEPGVPRRAGVSAFAVGGVNAHVVLEEAPPAPPAAPSRPWQLLVLSARSPAVLEHASQRLAAHLGAHPELALADVAHTLQLGRRPFEHRRAVVARDPAEAAVCLAGNDARRVLSGLAGGRRSVAFLFPGLGNHYPGMASELYAGEPVMRAEIDRCCHLLLPELGRDLRVELLAERPATHGGDGLDLRALLGRSESTSGELRRTLLAQPALFVVEWALAQLWRSWGIEPSALVGYSVGEYVAATLAGVMSLPDALRLVARRARMIDALPAGAMLAVSLPEAEAAALLGAELSISAVVTPAVCIVAGPVAAIERLETRLGERGVTRRRLETTHAFHSQMMRPIVERFRAVVAEVALAPPQIPLLSNVTGSWMSAEQATDPRTWAAHLVAPVRFAAAIEELWREPGRVLVEVGAGQTLGAWALQHPASAAVADPVAVSSLPHALEPQPELAFLLRSLGRLWLAGVEPSWEGFWAGERRRRVSLPTYPFERKRYWIDPPPPGSIAVKAEPTLEKRPDLDDWLYVPVWQEALPAPWLPSGEPRCWLILVDGGGVGETLAAVLRGLGHEVGTAHEADATLLRSLRDQGRFPDVVVHCRSVGAEGAQLEIGFSSLLALAQALGEVRPDSLELAVVVAGLCDVTGAEPLDPLAATVLGPARVIPQEYPGVTCRVFDVIQPVDPKLLAAALLTRDLEHDLVALRGRRRWVESYRALPRPAAAKLREGGVYLITGGWGGIGKVLAGRLAQTGKARLALIGRSTPPDDPELRALGAALYQADVTDRAAMGEVVADVRRRFGTLHGVIHAAGVFPEGLIQLKTPEAAAAVLAPKVEGTRVLAEALAGEPLDFFLLCSSLTSRMGGLGLVDHVAANAFLDAFAVEAQNRHGLPVTAVAWDTWLEVGQAARGARRAGLGSVEGEVFGHPLLERRRREGGAEIFETLLDAQRCWVVDEHRLGERRLLPGTAYLEMARAAFETAEPGDGPVVVEGLVFVEPLWVEPSEPRRVRLTLAPAREGRRELRVESLAGGKWREHARAGVHRGEGTMLANVDLQALEKRLLPHPVDGDHDGAFFFGPRWNAIDQQVWRGPNEVLTRLTLDERFAADLAELPLHSALLDWATGFVRALRSELFLPLSYQKVVIHGGLTRRVYSHVHALETIGQEGDSLVCDLAVLGEDGRPRLEVSGFVLRRAALPAAETAAAERGLLERAYGEGIRPQEGAEVFERLLALSAALPQVLVSVRDFEPWRRHVREVSHRQVLEAVGKLRGARARHARPALATAYVAPRSGLEIELCALWQGLLGLEQVGIHDGFFELGGDSLLATQLLGEIQASYKVELPLRDLFAAPTVAELAMRIVGRRAELVDRESLDALLDQIEDLSPDQLESLLEEERMAQQGDYSR